jgi:hypothetical protein
MGGSVFEKAFEDVQRLVATFSANEKRYLSPDYQEAEARKDFIDKFWIVLGWDVNHDRQTNPYEQEVKVERSSAAGGQRRADYAFYLAPNFHDVRFIVEAKKPSVDVETNENYFRVIRYGWNNDTPLAVLTDFETLHIIDSRYEPDVESALHRAVARYHYSDYTKPDKFAEIYWLFSREAVAAGSLEKCAKELPKPRGKAVQRGLFPGGYQRVDESFLAELDEHRTALARTFKNRNPKLDSETLTELAQRTLDRLVFLRFLEDKGIEGQRLVDRFGEKGTAWGDFVAASRRLDGIYNGIVFRHHDILDADSFQVDDKVFAYICETLAHVNSPYDFNAIPIHILGSIYERFLGKVIVATAQRARVEEKPEVRRAGGVYYTPAYIVRYIVENTVGKLIAGKTPEQIATMRFADIACGSGSFLLGVFDLLLDYHGHYYNENPRKARRGDCVERDGRLYLSLHKKREILLNNIYGVDVDAQAVEVCQFSLYLKLLQEETEASAHQYLLDFAHTDRMQRLLPDLGKNIVCGNSLIGPDILEGELFASDEERALNPMDFASAFPEVTRRGGFDAVVGNPPYIRMEAFKPLKNYLRLRYSSHEERADLYIYFVEKANRLLKVGGRFGMIVSNKFLRAKYGNPLREFLRENVTIVDITDFAGLPVFRGATVRTIVLIAERGANERPFQYSPPLPAEKFSDVETGLCTVREACSANAYEVAPSAFRQSVWSFPRRDAQNLLARVVSNCKPLVEYCNGKIGYGIKTGLKDAFIIDEGTRARLVRQSASAKEVIKPYLDGRDIRRYFIEYKGLYIIYTYHGLDIRRYPSVEEYLRPYRTRLQKRATQQAWYELQQPQRNYEPHFEAQKIVYPDIATVPRFALDDVGFYGSNTTFFVGMRDPFLLALLNSRLGYFYFAATCAALEGKKESYLRFLRQYVERFPVRKIDPASAADKARHDEILAKAESMSKAKKKATEMRTDKDKTYYENKCAALDREINQLVYDLYGLKDGEVAIIEQATAE